MDAASFVSVSEAQTLEMGNKLGRLLNQPALILLQGDLGAGKSVLARGIARGLGVDPQIPITSPTFTLMNHYLGRLDLYHFDLYRLSDPDELIEIGFDDYAFGSAIALVEWPEKIEDPDLEGLWISISRKDENQRKIMFVSRGGESKILLDKIIQCLNKDDKSC